jgi:hypothetical protein
MYEIDEMKGLKTSAFVFILIILQLEGLKSMSNPLKSSSFQLHSGNEPSEVIVVGSLNVDLVFYAPRLPNEGETLLGTAFDKNFGGKGGNQAGMFRFDSLESC